MQNELRQLLRDCKDCVLVEECENTIKVVELRERVRQTAAQNEGTKDGEACFSIGFCFYKLWDYADAIRWLGLALTLDENHQEAHRYLGHSLFDKGRYSEAQQHLEVAARYPERYQYWVQLKLEELVVCCSLYTSTDETAVSAACKVVREYRDAPQDEVALPTELVVCVSDLVRNSPNGSMLKLCEAVRRMLTDLELTEAFSEELTLLRC